MSGMVEISQAKHNTQGRVYPLADKFTLRIDAQEHDGEMIGSLNLTPLRINLSRMLQKVLTEFLNILIISQAHFRTYLFFKNVFPHFFHKNQKIQFNLMLICGLKRRLQMPSILEINLESSNGYLLIQ